MRGRKKAGMESRSPFSRLELKQTHHFRWGFSPPKTIRRKSRCLLSALEGVASRLGFVKPVALLSYSNQSQPQRTTSLSSAPGSSLSRSSPPHLFTSNHHSWFIFDRTPLRSNSWKPLTLAWISRRVRCLAPRQRTPPPYLVSWSAYGVVSAWVTLPRCKMRLSPGLHMAWFAKKRRAWNLKPSNTIILAHSQLASLLWFSDTHLSQQKSEDLTAIFLKYLQWSQSTCSLFMFFIKSSDTASFDLKKKIF